MKLMEKLGGLKTSGLTMMDLAIASILALSFIKNPFYQGMYFVFCSIFIVCLSQSQKPLREYSSLPLSLLLVWSLAGVFVRERVDIVKTPLMNNWLNTSIMFEGFVYVLFGVILFITVVKHASNTKFLLCSVLVALIPVLGKLHDEVNVSLLASVGIATLVYLVLNKQWVKARTLAALSVFPIYFKWDHIMMKWQSRPQMWRTLFEDMISNPTFGSGFNNTLKPENMVLLSYGNRQHPDWVYGWTFRHNDILSIGAYLGVVAFIAVLWFCLDCFKQTKRSVWIIPMLTIFLMCNFKMTFFYPERAAICIVLMALGIKSTTKERIT